MREQMSATNYTLLREAALLLFFIVSIVVVAVLFIRALWNWCSFRLQQWHVSQAAAAAAANGNSSALARKQQ